MRKSKLFMLPALILALFAILWGASQSLAQSTQAVQPTPQELADGYPASQREMRMQKVTPAQRQAAAEAAAARRAAQGTQSQQSTPPAAPVAEGRQP